MVSSPYSAPLSSVQTDRPPAQPPRSSFVAIVLGGFVVNFLGSITLLLITLLVLAFAAYFVGPLEERITHPESVWPHVLAYFSISVGNVVGGFVSARWARRRLVLHGGAAGALFLLLGVILYTLGLGSLELSMGLVLPVYTSIPLAILGGALARRWAVR